MEPLYYVIVGLLFVLAISDLIVGVTNDAVNFLSSAVGSKAATFRVVLVVAGIGVVLGAMLSNGMMEVARKGLFNPNMFMFSEIMLIFLAVMITDILLLDFFNTFGIPTSTTVSMIFEILGAAVAMALIKIYATGDSINTLGGYINSSKVLVIITGILLSVVIAFGVGSLLQYLTRILFTFQYEKRLKYYIGIFGGLAITGIVYFIMIKGMKDSSIISKDTYSYIEQNTFAILGIAFISLSIILQLLYNLFKVNVLKIIVISGTFALAMAFASNDLVNFIGVPMAGFKSFQIYQSQIASGVSPDSFAMSGLAEPIQSNIYMLLIAGLVMMGTLWLSKKARRVLETSIKLSKQDTKGKEQFGSSYLARLIVQGTTSMSKSFNKIIPIKFQSKLDSRFKQNPNENFNKSIPEDKPAFDMLRAAVNTLAASFLIAIGTSFKLPLSTTYVTFMVAMGTSMADRAWGRDTAVYRITGVLTIIGSWFFTAFVAFTAAFIVLMIIKLGGTIGLGVMVIAVAFLLIRTQRIHNKKEKEKNSDDLSAMELKKIQPEGIKKRAVDESIVLLSEASKMYEKTFQALYNEERKKLKSLNKDVWQLNKQSKKHKESAFNISSLIPENQLQMSNTIIQTAQVVREITYSLNYITTPAYLHVNNVHHPLTENQKDELNILIGQVKNIFEVFIDGLKNKSIKFEAFNVMHKNIIDNIDGFRINQLKRTQNETQHDRTNLLYLGLLNETGNIVAHMNNLVNYCRSAKEWC